MYWLYVLFLINGTWIPGESFEGWEPRGPYPNRAACIVEMLRSEMDFSENPREHPARFVCSSTRPRSQRDIEDCSLVPNEPFAYGGARLWFFRCS
jgi:hypothetical protein